jgi:hypothetical protein
MESVRENENSWLVLALMTYESRSRSCPTFAEGIRARANLQTCVLRCTDSGRTSGRRHSRRILLLHQIVSIVTIASSIRTRLWSTSERVSVKRRSFLDDQSTHLFDARRIMIGICITAATYAILQVSRAEGNDNPRVAALSCFSGSDGSPACGRPCTLIHD